MIWVIPLLQKNKIGLFVESFEQVHDSFHGRLRPNMIAFDKHCFLTVTDVSTVRKYIQSLRNVTQT